MGAKSIDLSVQEIHTILEKAGMAGGMHAARVMFHAPFPLVLFDTGTHLTVGPLEETEKYVKPHGELGEYLYNYRLRNPYYLRLDKGYFDMGDIAALIDPSIASLRQRKSYN